MYMSFGLQLLGERLVLHVHLRQLLPHLVMNLHELAHAPVQADGFPLGQVAVVVTWRNAFLLAGGGQSDVGNSKTVKYSRTQRTLLHAPVVQVGHHVHFHLGE